MRQDIRLFLADKQVDFVKVPEINFNYTLNDLSDPAAIKNGFSKTITIMGTPNNNDIFGHIYDFTRFQDYGEGVYSGTDFNPLQKTDFTIYSNGEIYESGYFKLTEVRKNHNNYEYDITLFGGLGQYFYNLSFKGDESGAKLEIADLFNDVDLDFEITKETVKEAWDNIDVNSEHYMENTKWEHINFAPCYNGVPSNFEADKVYMKGVTIPASNEGGTFYTNGKIGTAAKQLTEWETKDLRSYLQRPVVNVKKIIDACCDPNKNGGYEVRLDTHFFHYDNPYYNGTWLTLPLLRDLDSNKKMSDTIHDATLVKYNLNRWNINTNLPTLVGYKNADIKIKVSFNPTLTQTVDSLYTNYSYKASGGLTLQQRFIKELEYSNSLIIQMVGFNSVGEIIAYSNVMNLCSDRTYGVDSSFSALGGKFPLEYEKAQDMYGSFKKIDGEYVWCNMNGDVEAINFSFDTDTPFTDIALMVYCPYKEHYQKTAGGGSRNMGNIFTFLDLFTTQRATSNHWQEYHDVIDSRKVTGQVQFSVESVDLQYETYENYFSHSQIKGSELLTLGITPCDFLLSYCKQFGLYFYKHATEKVIEIMDRHTFYNVDDVVNLDEYIDRSKQMKIAPQIATSKWYDFKMEQVESEANNDYRYQYGMDYGTHRLNTHYNFDSSINEVFKDNVIKGGIDVLEKDIYFRKASTGIYNKCQPYIFNGFTYKKSDDTDVTITSGITTDSLNPDYEGYDAIAKPQFHLENNEGSDGDMVLLFLDYTKPLNDTYYLTDDVKQMLDNSDSPCWLLTNDTDLIIPITSVPYFTRALHRNESNYITHSLDMGRPMLTYVPEVYNTEGMSIYDKYWKNYIEDLYSVNNRKLTCYCYLKDKPNPEWMRRFYYFDNNIWRLNKISDWNIASYDTTQMEFVKVMDLFDYQQFQSRRNSPLIDIYFSDIENMKRRVDSSGGVENSYRYYYIDSSAQTHTLTVTAQDGYGLFFTDDMEGLPDWIHATPPLGNFSGNNQQFQITFDENTTNADREFSFKVTDEVSRYAHAVVIQKHGTYLSIGNVIDNTTGEEVEVIPNDSYLDDETRYYIEVDSTSPWEYRIEGDVDIVRDAAIIDNRLWFNVSDNTTGKVRYLDFIFNNSDGQIQTLHIVQEVKPYLSISPVYFNGEVVDKFPTITSSSDFYNINVDTNIPWEAYVNDYVKIEAKLSDNRLVFTVESNSSTEPRDITIMIVAGGLTESITLQQSGRIQEHTKLYYTSTDGNIVTPYTTSGWGANIISNTYTDGQGIIEFDDTINVIPFRGFYYCKNLRTITIPTSINTLGDEAFYSNANLVSVNNSDSLLTIGDEAFAWCLELTNINIPDSVTSIGDGAFYECRNLTNIVLSNIVTIGKYTFSGCESLTNINIPDSVTSISEGAFYYCVGLTNINIPDSVTSIGNSVFSHCMGLTSINIPDSVTSIGEAAFSNCKKLTNIVLGKSITNINNRAFLDCTSLKTINITAVNAPNIDSTTFRGVGSYGTLYYPAGSDYSTWLSTNAYYLGYYHWNETTLTYGVWLESYPESDRIVVRDTIAENFDMSTHEAMELMQELIDSPHVKLGGGYSYETALEKETSLLNLNCEAYIEQEI